MTENKNESVHFIEQFVLEDMASGKHGGRIHTRFPPEPNGFLHIGHSKAIILNFDLAAKYGGKTNLRFDDTNPAVEDVRFVENIKKDIHWLGYDWEDREYYASDYFPTLFEYAVKLIKKGKAYVDHSSAEEMSKMRGTPTKPGVESPYRNRSIEENLELFTRMKNGEFDEGECVLRAKIDMSSPNMHMRDPVMYRIKKTPHHRTGDQWVIYPTYDFAHGQSDSIEKITHSLCTLEFENHRPLYDWFIQELEIFPSRQIEFARLNLNYTVMSKRKLLQLVTQNHVNDWDDPRMPTLAGMRRRGYTPEAIRRFIYKVGIAKRENIIDLSYLEHVLRDDLNNRALRRMVVSDPVKVVITNFPDELEEQMPSDNNPRDEKAGQRTLLFTKELYIERADFEVDPPKKYHRLKPGGVVRLKNGFIIQCEDFDMDANGKVTEIHCTYFPDSRSGSDTSGIKAKGVIHWVSAKHGVPVELRLYDRLFLDENPLGHPDKDFLEFINPDSLKVIPNAIAEPAILDAETEERYQFLRMGYFTKDPDSTPGHLVFNRTVTLRDSWAKQLRN